MCFSAEASFGLSAVLFPAGIYCVQSSLRKVPLLLPLAIIPLLFGTQQVAEGLVWTGLHSGNVALVKLAALVFLFFALALWPFWVPFCAYFTHESGNGKVIYGLVSVFGLLAGLGVYIPLAIHADFPIADVENHSIHYNAAESPTFQYVPLQVFEFLYLALVSSPLLTSMNRKILFMGIALVLSAAMSYLLFWYAFASIWCFFAAMLSLYLCAFFRNQPAFSSQQVLNAIKSE